MRTKPKVWTTCPRISEPRYRKRSLPFRSPRGGWSLGAGRASICSSIAARRTGGRACSTFWASRCWRCVDKKLPQFVWRMNSSRSIHPDQGSDMPQLLAPLAVSLMSVVCTFAAAVSGVDLRKKLPDDHLSEDSKDVIKLVMGLTATMAALVLGLRRVIVEDHVDDLSRRNIRLDRVEETNELLMPMALHAAPDNLALDHVERGKEGCRATALVIMGHRAGAAFLHRQSRLRAVEGLDLRFLVEREHDSVRRRIDIGEFFDEAFVLRQFERADAMRREAVRPPNALNRMQADAGGLRHGAARPMRRFTGRLGERQIDDALDEVGGQRSLAWRPRLVAQKTVNAFAHEALLPAPDDRLGQPRSPHDLQCAAAVGGRQDNAGARRVLLQAVAISDDPIKASPIFRRDFNNDPCSHTQSMRQITAFGNPPNASFH